MNTGLRFMAAMAAVLAALFIGGCSTPMGGSSVRYSYDPVFGFPGAKTYRWAESGSPYGWDPLMEANVRFLSDRLLAGKGLTKTDQAALSISIRYESSGYSYELRALSLNVYRADTNQMVWRGLATGTIRTDAASVICRLRFRASWPTFPRKNSLGPRVGGVGLGGSHRPAHPPQHIRRRPIPIRLVEQLVPRAGVVPGLRPREPQRLIAVGRVVVGGLGVRHLWLQASPPLWRFTPSSLPTHTFAVTSSAGYHLTCSARAWCSRLA